MKTKAKVSLIKFEGVREKLTYLGAGVGLGLFAIFGLLNASLIGGILGINIAGMLFGFPIPTNLITRAFVAIGMLGGVAIAGLVFTSIGAAIGWVAGASVQLAKGVTKAESKATPKAH